MRARFLALVLLAACGTETVPETPTPGPAKLDIPADAPLVIFLGDSISAGLHLPEDEAFPAVIQRRLFERGVAFRLINAGHSGDTTAGGLRRAPFILERKPAIVVVELGGNDGLRGQPLENMRKNLDGILAAINKAGAKALLLGMRIPTNYGPEYTEGYAKMYEQLAQQHGIAFVPYFMEPIAGNRDYFLDDELHPNPEGHKLLADKVGPALEKLLK